MLLNSCKFEKWDDLLAKFKYPYYTMFSPTTGERFIYTNTNWGNIYYSENGLIRLLPNYSNISSENIRELNGLLLSGNQLITSNTRFTNPLGELINKAHIPTKGVYLVLEDKFIYKLPEVKLTRLPETSHPEEVYKIPISIKDKDLNIGNNGLSIFTPDRDKRQYYRRFFNKLIKEVVLETTLLNEDVQSIYDSLSRISIISSLEKDWKNLEIEKLQDNSLFRLILSDLGRNDIKSKLYVYRNTGIPTMFNRLSNLVSDIRDAHIFSNLEVNYPYIIGEPK